ncbi:MAG: hypothetical protein P0107_06340 [Nitrosomonas sp.]|nr:hypothetical protein [Nitrosomonas sp.]
MKVRAEGILTTRDSQDELSQSRHEQHPRLFLLSACTSCLVSTTPSLSNRFFKADGRFLNDSGYGAATERTPDGKRGFPRLQFMRNIRRKRLLQRKKR